MFSKLRWLLPAPLILVASIASAVDYSEVEPNDAFPPAFLPGNPIFSPGSDRVVGSINGAAGDEDVFYLRTAGTAAPGIYRYVFNLNSSNAAADTALDLFDASSNGYYLGRSDDPATGVATPPVTFDHLDFSGAVQTFGLDVQNFNNETTNYGLSYTRQLITPSTLGTGGAFSTTVNDTGANANWFKFTAGTGNFSLTTTGSFDTEFVLYNSSGVAVIANDDQGTNLNAGVTNFALAGGTYYLAVGQYDLAYDYDLTTNAPLGWDRPGVGRNAPFGADIPTPATYGLSGSFVAASVPEPASIAALGLGALALLRRRKIAKG